MWSMLYQSLVDPLHLFAWFGRAILDCNQSLFAFAAGSDTS